jgi:hypothetical protein
MLRTWALSNKALLECCAYAPQAGRQTGRLGGVPLANVVVVVSHPMATGKSRISRWRTGAAYGSPFSDWSGRDECAFSC